MLPILLFAISRCASPTACPSDAELIAAISQRNLDDVSVFGSALQDEAGGDVHMHTPPRVSRIEDVRCDEFVNFQEGYVTCTWIVRYGRTRVREIAKLTRQGSRWTIIDSLSVWLTSRR